MIHHGLDGMVPDALRPRAYKLHLRDHDIDVDIGFHPHEMGQGQRLRVNIEVWLDPVAIPRADAVEEAWNYDFLRTEIAAMTRGRRFNLQETLAREIYDLVAARDGVRALRVSTAKLDIYPDCAAVGVELASF